MDTPPKRLPVRYFDGRSSRAQAAKAWLDGGQLHLLGPTVQLTVPVGVQTGTIEDLTLGYTVIKTQANQEIVVPNSVMASQAIIKLA